MPNVTLSVPEDLYKLMKQHPEVRWSVVAREALWAYARRLDVMERIASNLHSATLVTLNGGFSPQLGT